MGRLVLPLTIGLVLTSGLVSSALLGQNASKEPDVPELARLAREQGQAGYAIPVLRREGQPRSSEALEALADTLAAIAIELPGDDVESSRIASASLETLTLAGAAGRKGTPFEGAAERLLLVAERARDIGMRGAALFGLTQNTNRAQAREMLRRVAISDNPVAYIALNHLANDVGPEGLAMVRQLHDRGMVKQPRALATLSVLAAHYGWK